MLFIKIRAIREHFLSLEINDKNPFSPDTHPWTRTLSCLRHSKNVNKGFYATMIAVGLIMNTNDKSKPISSKARVSGAILVLLLIAACMTTPAQLISAAKTAAAEGKTYASTQLPAVKETAVLSVTEIGPPSQISESELATQVAKAASDNPNAEVAAAREKLKTMPAMKSPWNQVDAPLKSSPGQRSAGIYANVIDQFDVNASAFAERYVTGGSGSSEPRSNIFAGDVMRAMGVPLPTKGNLGKGSGTATYADPETAQTWLLNDYLNKRTRWVTSADDKGVESDWIEIVPTTPAELRKLVEHVNAGKPALVSDADHIAVIRPNQTNPQGWEDLLIAQAGLENTLKDTLSFNFIGTPQFFMHE